MDEPSGSNHRVGRDLPRRSVPGIWLGCLLLFLFALAYSGCVPRDRDHRIVISVADQAMQLYWKNRLVANYLVSTSRFGLGDAPGSSRTPLGRLEIARKIGAGAALGAVFKDRRPTGEILPPNAPGRDPIVTRILWLKGTEPQNQNALSRYIYIHGTPEEHRIGTPASFGCIRMRSRDVASLFDQVGVGAAVEIRLGPLDENPVAAAVPNQ